MTKRIMAITGSYTNKQNEQKGEWKEIGVILSKDGKEFILLDPSVSLAGILAKQNIEALNSGKNQRDNIMCSIFEEESQQNNANNQPQNNQQQNNQRAPNQNQQQGGQQQPYQQQNNQQEPNF